MVLDEPNSNLDQPGEAALAEAILTVRRRCGIVVVIAHRPSALVTVDKILGLFGGQVQAFGPKDEALRKLVSVPAPRPDAGSGAASLKVVADVGGGMG